jgi:hypothetical protein
MDMPTVGFCMSTEGEQLHNVEERNFVLVRIG